MDTILVPYDFSAVARNAANYAAHLANFLSGKIILFHCTHVPVNVPDFAKTETSLETSILLAEKELEKVANALREFCPIEVKACAGLLSDALPEMVKESDADLIVMGILGEGGVIKEYVMGSNAVRTAKNAEIPVLVVPDTAKFHKIRKMAFACDLGEDLEKSTLLVQVKFFANLFDAELDVVNVEKAEYELTESQSHIEKKVEKGLEHIPHRTYFVTANSPSEGILEYLKEHPADLLVVAPKRHSLFEKLFKTSVSSKIAFHSKQPVLFIHM